jgi:O-antigen biosynthesis protein
MMPRRTLGAPRLIEATGERIVPWAPDAQVIYEHYHRYLWAQPLVADRRVLDLGSGEGFGAALLADTATAVVGVDIDERTVEHSRANYVADGLEFRVASATDLRAFEDGSFDAVVAFEMIEHVAEHEQVLAEIARVLGPGGLLIMSTPERRAYSDDRDFVNPFHERELTQEEFTALLSSHFSSVSLFAQNAVTGSRIEVLGSPSRPGHLALPFERGEDEWRMAGAPPIMYLIAIAANVDLPPVVGESSLFDYGLEVITERQTTFEAELRERRDEYLADADAMRARFVAELDEKQAILTATQADLAAEKLRAHDAEQALRQMKESTTWQLLERGRRVLYGTIGGESRIARGLSHVLARFSSGRKRQP